MRARVYVAGPMTLGEYMGNVRAGIDAAEELMRRGFAVFVPHLDAFWGLCHKHTYDEWLEHDFAWVRACDALLRIPGESRGGDLEVAHARGAGIPVFYSVEDLERHFSHHLKGAV